MIRLVVVRPGGVVEELASPTEAKEALEAGGILWADLYGRSPESDELLGQVFGFHPLAIEDVYKQRHRPKVEDYDAYLYLIVRAVHDDTRLEEVITDEVDLFLGRNFVVTHHTQPLRAIDAVRAELGSRVELLSRGSVFLGHAVLDRVVDGFIPLSERFMREVDTLEDEVLAGEDRLARIVELKGSLHRLRRLCSAQLSVLERLARAEFDEIPDEARPFFRDVHEHMAQVTEALENERDELNAVFDAYHSLSAHRMNEIMKVLTLISTIMLPLTFLAGVYGMNFKHMPELEWSWGYPALWGVMLAISLAMVGYFRRRGWL
ncbi:MAG: magnesium/cobalt transporter CorA [Planctomycetota bacterium]